MPDEAREIFVRNLRYFMETRGISQADICRELDKSSATVSDWCSGKKYPRIDAMQQLADLLGVRLSALTGELFDRSRRMSHEDVETMYERIRDLRIQQGMSQDDLAKLVGYKGRSMITRIEAGEVNISETKIKAFAGAFGTTTEYLMNGTKPKNKLFDEILCMAYHEAPEAIQLAVRKLLELEGLEE